MVMAEKDTIRNGLYTLVLYWMISILKSRWLTSGLVHMLLVRQTSPKGRGAYVRSQKEAVRTVRPWGRTVRGPDCPRWWRGRSARAQSQLGFLVSRGICYLKPWDWLGNQFEADPDLPLYIDEGLRPIEPPTIDQIHSTTRFYLMH
jgi:hypothetical protein